MLPNPSQPFIMINQLRSQTSLRRRRSSRRRRRRRRVVTQSKSTLQ
jgi:hypothetical protein